MANLDEVTPSPEQKAQKPLLPIFVHSRVDEYGLTPSQFRLYAHIARRDDNKANGCYASIDSMARVCKLHATTVRHGLRDLVECGLVAREERRGYTTIYRVTPLSQWHPAPRSNENPGQRDTPVLKEHPSQTNAPVSDAQDCQTATVHPSQLDTAHPSQSEAGKGNPLKEIQKEGDPNDASAAPPSSVSGSAAVNKAASGKTVEEVILAHLNKCARTAFRPSYKNRFPISERLRDIGNDVAGVCRMISRQTALWKDDPKMARYLRPKTLFGANFDDYFDQRDAPVPVNAGGVSKSVLAIEYRTRLDKVQARRQVLYDLNDGDSKPERAALAKQEADLKEKLLGIIP